MMKVSSDNWESAVVSPETAIEKIRPGMIIFLGTAMAEPRTMVRHLPVKARLEAGVFNLVIPFAPA
ncbi:MAG: hypothetical protein Q7U40_02815 [Desulfatirhabdiaceae bacterium]|nr:hypothetical protein [Desulfatirhabdiaceae bacterium]